MSTPRGESERLGQEQDFLLPWNGMLIILIWTLTDGTPEGWKTLRDRFRMWYFNSPVRQRPLQGRNRAYESKAAPEVQQLTVAKQGSNLGLGVLQVPRGVMARLRLSASCPEPFLLPGMAQVPFPASSLSCSPLCPASSVCQQELLQKTGENALPPRITLQPLGS